MSASSEKRVRCLVIQLGRLGDNLQSLMALRAAKQLYPQLEITLVTRDRFSSAAKRVPWIEKVVELPTVDVLLPILEGKESKEVGLAKLSQWLIPLVENPWDLLLNWTYSEASSFLSGLVPARIKLGYTRRKDGSISVYDGWSHYIQSVLQGGFPQNIHLTDILTTQLLTALQIHLGDPVDAGNAPVSSKSFFQLDLQSKENLWNWKDPTRKWIGIQIATGQSRKTWPASKWARVAELLLSRHPDCRIVLLGESKDQKKSDEIMEVVSSKITDSSSIVSMVGKTDFDLWANIVGRCQWILASDTAVVHLAGVLGTRVLEVGSGSPRFWETGPYGNGHYVISSIEAEGTELPPEISPEAVYSAWSYASTEWAHRRQISMESHFGQLGWSSEIAKIRVFRTKIRPTNDGGGVVYEPQFQRPIRAADWAGLVWSYTARAWYCGWTPPVGHELERSQTNPSLVQIVRPLQESADVLIRICDEARRTAGSLHQRTSKMKSEKIMDLSEKNEVQDLGKKLLELDQLLQRLAQTHPVMQPYGAISQILMHNLRGESLAEISRETAEVYQQLGQGAVILRDWIRHTLNLVKPVAIQQSNVIELARPKGEKTP